MYVVKHLALYSHYIIHDIGNLFYENNTGIIA